MNTITIVADDGTRLACRVDGPADAPAVLFANSLGTDLRMWDSQVAALSERLRVVRFDARGHGASDVTPGPYTVERLGRDLVAVLDGLGIERTHLCGLSLGGMVALQVAACHQDRVDRAIYASTASRIGTTQGWEERIAEVRAGGMQAVRETVVARFLSAPFRSSEPQVARWIGDMVEATPAAGYVAACAALRDGDLSGQVATIRAPSLVIAGALDEATPVAQAHALQAAIAGSALVVLNGAGHLSNVERPEEFARWVLAFLTRS